MVAITTAMTWLELAAVLMSIPQWHLPQCNFQAVVMVVVVVTIMPPGKMVWVMVAAAVAEVSLLTQGHLPLGTDAQVSRVSS